MAVDSTELQPLLVDKGDGGTHTSVAEKRLNVFEDNLVPPSQEQRQFDSDTPLPGEFSLNKYSFAGLENDEYRPILSEDELEDGRDGDDEYSDEEDQLGNLLIKVVNGDQHQDKLIDK